ncbi:hypothetical protein MKW94_021616 [Papaver nudicaule]|uniref:Histone deacetylase interacting domain-containing protein n=1 Tax=Papaver nudicaule TaxID=74823 RepID=A0AA41SH05_PAPNU|nr:hypothetical protein [Papaver nudicaule]
MEISIEQIEAYRAFLQAVQQTDKCDGFVQVMKEYLSLQERDTSTFLFVAARIKDVFRGHSKLILDFNNFLPQAYEITLGQAVEEDDDEQTESDKAIDSDKGSGDEQTLASADEFNDEAADSDEVLQHGDEQALARVDELKVAADSGRVLHYGEYHLKSDLFETIIKEKSRDLVKYQQLLKCLHLYSKEIIRSDELVYLVNDLLSDQNPKKNKRETGFEASTSKRRKYDHNPSYERSTEITLASGRTRLGKALLNDSWVLKSTKPTGDKYRFKNNIYQDNLFECEDERCEFDRQFNLVKGTIKCVKDLKRDIKRNIVNPRSMRIKDHLNVLQVGCIRRLCSKHCRTRKSLLGGSDKGLVEAICKNGIPVLDLILTELEKQQDKVEAQISHCSDKMKEVYSKNLKKSLDYGNSSLEQQDTTIPSTKDDASTCPDLLLEAKNYAW